MCPQEGGAGGLSSLLSIRGLELRAEAASLVTAAVSSLSTWGRMCVSQCQVAESCPLSSQSPGRGDGGGGGCFFLWGSCLWGTVVLPRPCPLGSSYMNTLEGPAYWTGTGSLRVWWLKCRGRWAQAPFRGRTGSLGQVSFPPATCPGLTGCGPV